MINSIEVQQPYPRKVVCAVRAEESDHRLSDKSVGEKLEALLGELWDDKEQCEQQATHWESTKKQKEDMNCHTCHQKDPFSRDCMTNPFTCPRKWTLFAVVVD